MIEELKNKHYLNIASNHYIITEQTAKEATNITLSFCIDVLNDIINTNQRDLDSVIENKIQEL